MALVINGLVTKKIPVLKAGNLIEDEVQFFFGTLTFKLMKQHYDLDLKDLDKKVDLITEDPVAGLDFVLDFLYTAHKAWCTIGSLKQKITKDALWLSIDVMGPGAFAEIINEGMEHMSDAVPGEDSEEGKKKIKAKPRTKARS